MTSKQRLNISRNLTLQIALSLRAPIAASMATVMACACSRPPRASETAEVVSDLRPHAADVDGGAQAVTVDTAPSSDAPSGPRTVGPGFPTVGPWVSFYGTAAQMGDLARVASAYRIINIDADPGTGNFTSAQLGVLRAGGANRVLSYFNVGACEHFRTYWSKAPLGFTSCSSNKAAQRGAYEGYPDETWMDLGDERYQSLLLGHVAPRLAANVDGFYLDNLEILEHSPTSSNGPCSPACRQGGLDFVRRLRARFPRHLIVMQNATGDVTRNGMTGGVRFATLLDGIAHEEVYAPTHDAAAESELLAWKAMGLSNDAGRPFWIGIEDYVGSCGNKGAAHAALARARARGFAPYASDESGAQKVVCFWE